MLTINELRDQFELQGEIMFANIAAGILNRYCPKLMQKLLGEGK